MLTSNGGFSADQSATNAPFRNLRQNTLEYVGPELDEPEATNATEVLIAWFAPADPKHEMGGGMWTAANLALEDANRAGGFRGAPFRLVPHWSENPWTGGVGPLAKLVYEQPIRAILGSLDGAATHLAEQVVAQARLTLLSPVATDKSVNLAGVPWMFSCAPHDGQIAQVLAAGVLAAWPAETRATNGALVLFSVTDHDSRAAVKEILKAFRGRRPAISFQFECGPGAVDLAADVAAIRKVSPAGAIVVGNALDSARLARALRGACPRCELFGTQTFGQAAFLRHAGAAAEGAHFPLLYFPPATNLAARAFAERFAARQGEAPDYLAAFAYDATRLLIDAIRRAGLNRARIRNTLAQSEWPGIGGPVHWDGTGQNTRPVRQWGAIRSGHIVAEPLH